MPQERDSVHIRRILGLLVSILIMAGCGHDDSDMLIIKNGRVIDPETGRDEIAHVAIQDGVIKKISADPRLAEANAEQVIDAAGMVVSPGFIDTHSHEGMTKGVSNLEAVPHLTRYLVQDGRTFWLGGNCGTSPTGVYIPVEEGKTVEFGDYTQPLPEFFEGLDKRDLYTNCGFMSGNVTLRNNMGLHHGVNESDEQIQQMQAILAGDLKAGSFGVSYGLMYDQGASEKACLALAKISQAGGGMAACHTRWPNFNLQHLLFGLDVILFQDAIHEPVRTCRGSQVPFIVSHITDQTQSGSASWALQTIDEAIRGEGLPLASDILSSDFLSNDMYVLTIQGQVPVPLMFALGDYKASQFYAGRDLYLNGELYVKKYGQLTSAEADYLRQHFDDVDPAPGENGLSVPLICQIVPPEDTILALQYPWIFLGSDSYAKPDPVTGAWGISDPRPLATYSQLLGRWSRDEGALSLQQALFKACFAPAFWLGLDKKGRLQEGCDADIVVFDPRTIRNRAQWIGEGVQDLLPMGIGYVIVNGQVVVDHGTLTGATPGKLIRRTWKVPGRTTDLIEIYDQRFSEDS